VDFPRTEEGPSKDLETFSSHQVTSSNEQSSLDISNHPLYIASQEENARLHEQLNIAQKNEAMERNLAAESRRERASKIKELEDLKVVLAAKTKDFQQNKDQHARELEEKIAELNWAQQAANDARTELEAIESECCAKVQAAESKERTMKGKLEAVQLEIGMKEQSLQQSEERVERFENEIAGWKTKNGALEKQLANLKDELTRARAFRTDEKVEADQRAVREQLAEKIVEVNELKTKLLRVEKEQETARIAHSETVQEYSRHNLELKEALAEVKNRQKKK